MQQYTNYINSLLVISAVKQMGKYPATWREDTTLEIIHIDVRLILESVLKEQGVGVWTGFSWLRIASSGGPCEHGTEP